MKPLPRFVEILKQSGVDPLKQFMTVGLRGTNLVALLNARDFALSYERRNLDVLEVTRTTVGRVVNDLHMQFLSWGVGEDDIKSYLTAVHSMVSFGAHIRLFSVTGKMAGTCQIKAIHGPTNISLDVAVLSHIEFDVALRFVELHDESGTVSQTVYQPSDASLLLKKLNWIYGPQANASFDLTDAESLSIQLPNGTMKSNDRVTEAIFLKYVIGRSSQRADLTIFFVNKYWEPNTPGMSQTFSPPNPNACVVEDIAYLYAENPVPPSEDGFLVNLAHEVAHFLINQNFVGVLGHHDRPDSLMSRHLQTARIDPGLLKLINP